MKPLKTSVEWCIVDDILICGNTKKAHNNNLIAVLERARQISIRFNPDKCIIDVKELNYFGHVISSEGLKADTEKID